MNYWEECIKEAFEDAKIQATDEQIDVVTNWVEGAHDNYRMAHGYDCIPNPQTLEIEKLTEELKKEKNKIQCSECSGKGYITDSWGSSGRSSTSQCYKCRGEGKI